MKTAILFFGIHYKENYTHWYKNNILKIDFRENFENNKKYLLNMFNDKDLYLSTYESDINLENYFPKSKIKYHQYNNSNRIYQSNLLLMNGLKMIRENKRLYDLIIVSRFDLLFFENIIFDKKKFNIVSELEKKNLLDDNFYIFPINFLDKF